MPQVVPITSPKISVTLTEASATGQAARINGNFLLFDVLIQTAVLDKDLATPPGSPTSGDTYIVASSPTGAWTGKAKNLAYYYNAAWTFFMPKKGWRVHVDDENLYYKYDGSAWVLDGSQPTTAPTLTVVTKTSNFTASTSEAAVYLIDASSGNITATLPTASSADDRAIFFKRIDASANTVGIDGNSTETIDGEQQIHLVAQWDSIYVVSNGTAWYII